MTQLTPQSSFPPPDAFGKSPPPDPWPEVTHEFRPAKPAAPTERSLASEVFNVTGIVLVAVLFLVGFGAGYALGGKKQTVSQAEGRVFLNVTPQQDAGRYVESEAQVAISTSVIAAAAKNVSLTTNQLAAVVTSAANQQANYFTISAKGPDAAAAIERVNAVEGAYASLRAVRPKPIEQRREDLSKQLAAIQTQLTTASSADDAGLLTQRDQVLQQIAVLGQQDEALGAQYPVSFYSAPSGSTNHSNSGIGKALGAGLLLALLGLGARAVLLRLRRRYLDVAGASVLFRADLTLVLPANRGSFGGERANSEFSRLALSCCSLNWGGALILLVTGAESEDVAETVDGLMDAFSQGHKPATAMTERIGGQPLAPMAMSSVGANQYITYNSVGLYRSLLAGEFQETIAALLGSVSVIVIEASPDEDASFLAALLQLPTAIVTVVATSDKSKISAARRVSQKLGTAQRVTDSRQPLVVAFLETARNTRIRRVREMVTARSSRS